MVMSKSHQARNAVLKRAGAKLRGAFVFNNGKRTHGRSLDRGDRVREMGVHTTAEAEAYRANDDTRWIVLDLLTGAVMGQPHTSRIAASQARDKLEPLSLDGVNWRYVVRIKDQPQPRPNL